MPSMPIPSEAEWLALREMNIGGSDAAALFSTWIVNHQTVVYHAYEDIPKEAIYAGSCSPYSNAYKLYREKSGQRMPDDLGGVERVLAGQYLEPALAEWAKNKFGMKLRKVRRYHVHDSIPGWGASVDYEVHGPGMEPVEIKNVDGLIAKQRWVIEHQEILQAPLHIILQLQSYIGARNAPGGWIIACIGGNELARGYFKRHDPTIERLGEAITSFWSNVKAGNPPARVAEFAEVSEEFSDGGGGDSEGVIDLRENYELEQLAARYMRVKAHQDFIESYLGNVKAQLARAVGGASRALLPFDYRISWPVISVEEKEIKFTRRASTYRGGFTVSIAKPKVKKPKKAKE